MIEIDDPAPVSSNPANPIALIYFAQIGIAADETERRHASKQFRQLASITDSTGEGVFGCYAKPQSWE